jgi:hypothetical protein
MARKLKISKDELSKIERGLIDLAQKKLGWFSRTAPTYQWTREQMLLELGLLDATEMIQAATSHQER